MDYLTEELKAMPDEDLAHLERTSMEQIELAVSFLREPRSTQEMVRLSHDLKHQTRFLFEILIARLSRELERKD